MASVGTGSYWPWNDRQGRFSALRAGCFALVLVPALILAFQAWTHQLGSKPWTQAVHDTGTWALRILVITLAVTPLRRILDWNRLIGIRRMLGLSAMAYALGHLALYCIDLAFDWGLILSEIVKRFYLVVGITALLGLVALGITSTDGMIRRLGSGRWQRLHNLVYPIACLGLFHFALQSKIDVTQPVLLAGLFALLMAYRGLNRFKVPLSFAALALTGLGVGLATALAETAWYAFATGASAWLIFQANADIVVYQDWTALRPGHWVAAVGLALAVLHLFRKPAPRPERGQRRPAMASEAAGG
ncbi:protein-methionine-sulfoxide reductase heme-binding subunit MsrQ [Bosea sp. (in: a-proteobacteria)]|uniref:sulfite oxidase heme-binding subunit YedZ n=1 Tax=Bosea sp. (in: a-proteobacteria) TaxID=1871050 RepID=UPI002DDD5CD2|nr:protein-methionine-sulfoxide reductase heme-binding subunit MsrQ [Bosea sp. (in: a-proteobacteria)]HEV2512471.1 protein-methionine-sulfoxide reductase heme-binding subunit MsrQ [Bosea sp. (in: a-proteobacteria)]